VADLDAAKEGQKGREAELTKAGDIMSRKCCEMWWRWCESGDDSERWWLT